MGNEITDFSGWTASVEARSANHGLVEALGLAARQAAEDFGAALWFVEILGRRWSYLAGATQREPAAGGLQRVPFNGRHAMMVETWGAMSPRQQKEFASIVGRLIKDKSASGPAGREGNKLPGKNEPEKDDARQEQDLLGPVLIPGADLHGIHTARARENFFLAGQPVHPELVHAYGTVKLACARVNRELGCLEPRIADSIEKACAELAEGGLDEHIKVDALQGGAGTSTNMNVNEVIANRALLIMGLEPGRYDVISPLDHVNLHQSTNDTFPTALRLAAIRLLHRLEEKVIILVEAFQAREQEFSGVVKVGRTECQDAVLITLGREMGAYAEAFARDRWRIYKCEERLRTVNLGGTAVGTGLGAPRRFIFRAAEELRQLTGIGFARAENLVEATQNADVFVEVSGILKALASSLIKVAGDLRLLSSGPGAGIGEIRLPPRQAGSSIMPGKVNPVIPEAVTQAAMLSIGNDAALTLAASAGSLELNPFLPLVAHCLLGNCELLGRACHVLARLCVEGITADEQKCKSHVDASTAVVTSLVETIGYESASRVVKEAASSGRSIREVAVGEGLITARKFDELTSPEAVCRLGSPDRREE